MALLLFPYDGAMKRVCCTLLPAIILAMVLGVPGIAEGSVLATRAELAETAQSEQPSFPNLTLFPLDNSSAVTLDAFRGRPVLLTFWASWCSPCRWELPEFQSLYNELGGKGFVLITINVDQDKRAARRFLEMTEIAVPVYRVSQGDLFRLGVRSLPTSVLLKPDGEPIQVFQGYSPTVKDYVRELILEMLEEQADSQTNGETSRQ